MTSWALCQQLDWLLMQGAFETAAELYRCLQPKLPDVGRPEQIWARGLGAYALYRSGDLDSALLEGQAVLRLEETTPPVHCYCLHAYARVAELWLGAWARCNVGSQRARSLAKRAVHVARSAARRFPVAGPVTLLQQGTFHWLDGDRRRAARVWTRGLLDARRMALPYPEARLCHSLALTSVDGDASIYCVRSEQLCRDLNISRSAIESPALSYALR